MDKISWVAIVALLMLVAARWAFHLRSDEPTEFVLFVAIVLGLALASFGLFDWVPWLEFGTLAATISFYAMGSRGKGRRRRRDRHTTPTASDRFLG